MKSVTKTPLSRAASLIPEASAYVYNLLQEKLPATLVFHSPRHTKEVVAATDLIGTGSGLNGEVHALLLLAAWFHDTGFTQTYEDHEEASVAIATAFLEARDLPAPQQAQVARLIRATRIDQAPQDLSEAVLRDADLAHVGDACFMDRAGLLRAEWAGHLDLVFTDREWLELQLGFLSSLRFATPYARRHFLLQYQRNLQTVRRALEDLCDAPERR